MAKGTPEKIKRNQKLFELKAKMTFKNLSKVFNISETRAKQIYYRELRRRAHTPLGKKGKGLDKV